jgi:6-phosphogluconolactonase
MATQTLVYIGTYTRTGSKGIYVYRLDPASGALAFVSATQVENPSFLAFHPQHTFLYAVSEGHFEGKPGGGVSALALDPKTGALTLLNQMPSHGTSPCHLSVDQTGQFVYVANYGNGTLAAFSIQRDGSLGPETDFVQHVGSSINPQRQKGPHAHSINLDKANRFAFVPDLGMDKVMIYKLDLAQGKLIPNDPPFAPVHGGAGPRHMAFHPNNRYVYVINEVDSTMTVYTYDEARGALSEIQSLSTLPADFKGGSWCADVHVAASGKFVYGSNRGHDSIVIFGVDPATGKLTTLGYEPTQGKFPRNFGLAPSGDLLLAANQDGNNVVSFRVDQQTGKLTPTGHVIEVPMPVCVKFLTLPA